MPLIVNEHANGLILAELAGFCPILPQKLPRCQCRFLPKKRKFGSGLTEVSLTLNQVGLGPVLRGLKSAVLRIQ